MKHITKRILGYVGLFLVVAMTVVAYNLPAPAVATDMITDTITVTVVEPGTVEIIKPENGGTMIRDNGDKRIEFSYSGVVSAHFEIYKTVKGEKTELVQTEDIDSLDPSTPGTSYFELIDGLAEGNYIIEFTFVNQLGTEYPGNSVKFTYIFEEQNIPVPDTGTFTHSVLDDLNISQMDFLLTGLIVFFSVAGFSTYLVLRKRK